MIPVHACLSKRVFRKKISIPEKVRPSGRKSLNMYFLIRFAFLLLFFFFLVHKNNNNNKKNSKKVTDERFFPTGCPTGRADFSPYLKFFADRRTCVRVGYFLRQNIPNSVFNQNSGFISQRKSCVANHTHACLCKRLNAHASNRDVQVRITHQQELKKDHDLYLYPLHPGGEGSFLAQI